MLSKAAYGYFIDLYRDEFCSGIIRHCTHGDSPESYAAEIDCTPEVFPIWANLYPQFEIALHIAFWKSYAWWESSLKTNSDIDARIYKLVMGQRFKWAEDGGDMRKQLQSMTDEELETLARRLLSGDKQAAIDIKIEDSEGDEDEIK